MVEKNGELVPRENEQNVFSPPTFQWRNWKVSIKNPNIQEKGKLSTHHHHCLSTGEKKGTCQTPCELWITTAVGQNQD